MLRSLALPILALLLAGPASAQSAPDGQIDPSTWVSTPQGTFGGIPYMRYEAMFAGVTSNNRHFRVPCQIIAPTNPAQGSGLFLFDWLVVSTVPTAVGQEQADARYTMTDEFLFGRGISYATVRCDIEGIGHRSPVANSTRPWSDGLLDTSSEFILSAGDEFDIVTAYLAALRRDSVATQLLGPIQRRAAFGYSAAGIRVRGFLRRQAGVGQFDFSLVGGTGNGFVHPTGNGLAFSAAERDPLPGAGLEIDFQSETDIVDGAGAHKTRHESSRYRCYQFAGASHIRAVDAVEFGLPDPLSANTADWTPFFRTFFDAGNRWCDGIQPPPSIWLGAPNDPQIVRDANGNALVTHVGGLPVNSSGYRLPAVAVGENRYIPYAPSFDDGTFLGMFRSIGGSHIDLSANFSSHALYVAQVSESANTLVSQGYLLQPDADAIVQAAIQSNIGN